MANTPASRSAWLALPQVARQRFALGSARFASNTACFRASYMGGYLRAEGGF